MFNTSNNPYDLATLQRLAQMQMTGYQQNNVYVQPQAQIDKFSKIQEKLNSITNDERSLLLSNESFIAANNAYEQGLLGHIASKYRAEFNNSEEGQKLINNLELVMEQSLSSSRGLLEAERQQLKEVADLIKNNPEILDMIKK